MDGPVGVGWSAPKAGALPRSTEASEWFPFLLLAWVQVWVQLRKEKWLPISRKRHQIGQLDFRSFRLLTEMLQVRVLPGEPNSFLSITSMKQEYSVLSRKVENAVWPHAFAYSFSFNLLERTQPAFMSHLS